MSASRQTLCFTILILNQKLVGRSPSGVLLITVAKEKTSLKDVELRTTNSVAQKWHMLCQLADHWPALVKWTVQPQRGLKMQFYHRRRWWKGVNTWWTAVMTLVAEEGVELPYRTVHKWIDLPCEFVNIPIDAGFR